jgi:hypothetical protein
MKKTVWIVVALMTVFLALPAAAAQGRSKGKGKGKAATTSQSARKSGLSDHERERLAAKGHAFSKAHIRIIVDWFHNPANLQGLPPGLAKREHLPPGLQRHLERNGTLPPGLQKKIQPIPVDLRHRLPRYPDGIRVVFVVGHVILIETSTSAIVDIIKDVVKAF